MPTLRRFARSSPFVALVFSAILGGCGHYAVQRTGRVALRQTIYPPSIIMPSSVASGAGLVGYVDTPTYGVFYVENGTDEPFVARAVCTDGFNERVDLPPETGQRILVTTTLNRARDGLCHLASR